VCILYPVGSTPPLRRAASIWFQVEGPGLLDCVERYSVPTWQALVGAIEPSVLIEFIELVKQHQTQRHAYWQEAITILCRTFFRNLLRSISPGACSDGPTPYQSEVVAALRRVRGEVHSKLAHKWTLVEMAALANLSYSHYRTAFTKFFGVSPWEDLARARLLQARLLLRDSQLSVREIAEECGFCSTSQFYVNFKQRTGSPLAVIPSHNSRSNAWAAAGARRPSPSSIDDIALLYLEPSAWWTFGDIDTDPEQDFHFRFEKLGFSSWSVCWLGLVRRQRPAATGRTCLCGCRRTCDQY